MGSPSGLGLSSGTRMPVIWTAGSGQKTDLWGSASQRNVEAEGCGGGREAQNPLVFISMLTFDEDYCCQDQVGSNVSLQIKEAQRLCHELSLSVILPCPG